VYNVAFNLICVEIAVKPQPT